MHPISQHTWQHSLAHSITSTEELCELLRLDEKAKQTVLHEHPFPLRVSREFVTRIEPGNTEDPLLKQILPLSAELETHPGYSNDPLQEKKANPVPGLLHKYPGRVLFILSGHCAINCRFCFRRAFPYSNNNPGMKGWKKAIDYIAEDPRIEEVIFSGGDPLVLKDQVLAELAQQLSLIPHLKRLRIHTRLPIMIPSRVNDELLAWLTGSALQSVVVIHCNHPNEIDSDVKQALKKLRQHHIPLLNQSVLLKGINDNAETLIKLHQSLFECGVMPYYLHLLDPVEGTAHFSVSEQKARDLIREITNLQSGYLVPKLVCEIAGQSSKTNVLLDY